MTENGPEEYQDPSIQEAAEKFNAEQEEKRSGETLPSSQPERLENPQLEYAAARADLAEHSELAANAIELAFKNIMRRKVDTEEKVTAFMDWAARERKGNHEDEIVQSRAWAEKGDEDGSLQARIEYEEQLLPLFDRLVDANVARIRAMDQGMERYLEGLGKPKQ